MRDGSGRLEWLTGLLYVVGTYDGFWFSDTSLSVTPAPEDPAIEVHEKRINIKKVK
jgi:hypothetical protein